MKCIIVCEAYTMGPYGEAAMRARCEAHDFDLTHMPVVSASTLCPIGRIEEARDAALDAIRTERTK